MTVRSSRHWRSKRKTIQYRLLPWLATFSKVGHKPPPVLVNSIPKAGTNLARRVVCLLMDCPEWLAYHLDETRNDTLQQFGKLRRGQVVSGHFPHDATLEEELDRQQVRLIIVVRDIRDVIVSGVEYLSRRQHPLREHFSSLADTADMISLYIEGLSAAQLVTLGAPESWAEYDLLSFHRWSGSPLALIVRFEDLVGPRGGGSSLAQVRAIEAISNHLGLHRSNQTLKSIAGVAFNPRSRTFNRGQIGRWRQVLTEEHLTQIEQKYGRLQRLWGYSAASDATGIVATPRVSAVWDAP